MRHALLLLLSGLAACAGPSASSTAPLPRTDGPAAEPPPASAPAASAPAGPPRPFAMHASACPLKTTLKGPPACTFLPIDGAASGPVLKAERITCRVNGQTGFVGLGAHTALAMNMSVVEANTSFVVSFLRQPDGTVHLVPDQLTQPALLGASLVGFAPGPHRLAFWKDGQCEEPDDGFLSALAPVSDDEVVALVHRWDRDVEVLLRAKDGAWSSLGTVEAGPDTRLWAQGGRLSLEVDGHEAERELGLRFPDLERAEVVRRDRSPPTAQLIASVAPLAPRPGSRFGDAWVSLFAWESGQLGLARPTVERGYERVPLPVRLESSPCRPERDEPSSSKPRDKDFVHASQPGLAALSTEHALVAWVEQRGRCTWRFIPEARVHCLPNQPCRPPEPASWAPETVVSKTELVLWGAGTGARELVRVPLPATDSSTSLAGVALAVTVDRVFAQAWGHLVQLDRARLEGALR